MVAGAEGGEVERVDELGLAIRGEGEGEGAGRGGVKVRKKTLGGQDWGIGGDEGVEDAESGGGDG